MQKIQHTFIILFFCFLIISCAKESGSSSSSTTSTMSTPSIADGNYKLTAVSVVIYNSDGSNYGSGSFQVNHDTSVTPGYLGYGMSWQGSGVYRITVFGKATFSSTDLGNQTLDCTTNTKKDNTLDTNGKVTKETLIQTGCGGGILELTLESDTYTAISGGMTKVIVASNSLYKYHYTYTFQKQSTTTSTATELEGTWKSSCTAGSGSYYNLHTFTISGTDMVYKLEAHGDSNCSTDNYTQEWTYTSLSIGDTVTYESGTKTGAKFSIIVSSATETQNSSYDVAWADNNSYCGYTDWVLNVAKDIIGKTCGTSTYASANTKILSVYKNESSSSIKFGSFNIESVGYPSGVSSLEYTKQ